MSEVVDTIIDNAKSDTTPNYMSNEVFIENDEENGGLKFRLSDFEGPFDLLLELVKKAEIEIKDLFISDITDQYLKMMDDIGSIDVDRAILFIDVASRLLQIKSESVLPEPEIEDADEMSAKDLLLKQLNEYKMLKEATEQLQPQEIINRFYREPDFTEDDAKLVVKDFSFDKLMDAFTRMLLRVNNPEKAMEKKEIIRDRYTVADRIKYIAVTIKTKKKMYFSQLFDDDYSKSEAINTFLAMLQLLKYQYLTVKQETLYGDIEIDFNSDSKYTEDFSFMEDGEGYGESL